MAGASLLQIATLGELATIRMGYPVRSRLEPDLGGDVAVIRALDIDQDNRIHMEVPLRIVLPEGSTNHVLRAGDLLFKSRGQKNDVALVPEDVLEAVAAAPLMRIRPRDVLPEYLQWFLNSPAAKAQLAPRAEGTSVQMINTRALSALEVPLPPAPVQRRIAGAAALVKREHALLELIASERHRLSTHLLLKIAQQRVHPWKGGR